MTCGRSLVAGAAAVTPLLLTDELACCAGDVGTVFRRYPGMWQVFVEDLEAPGRYKLIAERPSSPAGWACLTLLLKAYTIFCCQPIGPVTPLLQVGFSHWEVSLPATRLCRHVVGFAVHFSGFNKLLAA